MKKAIFIILILFFLANVFASEDQYPDDIIAAYKYAYNLGVTTKPAIDEAMLTGSLIRSHAAKMLVNRTTTMLKYQITGCNNTVMWGDAVSINWDNHTLLCNTFLWSPSNKLGIYSNGERYKVIGCDFDDIDWQSQELKWYIIQACEMGLMGLDTEGKPMQSFYPKKIVTKAQFATILSRFLWLSRYNWGSPYYKKHIDALKAIGLMPNIAYAIFDKQAEIRAIIFLMLQWADKYLQCLMTDQYCTDQGQINLTFAKWEITYSTTWITNKKVIAYLTWKMLTGIASYSHVFETNGNRTFYFKDLFGRQSADTATVSWIQK